MTKATTLVQGQAIEFCPVDTGNLRASIHTTISNLEGAVGTPVEYAPYVEFGTSKMNAQPYLGPAFYENEQKIINDSRNGKRKLFYVRCNDFRRSVIR